MSKSIEVLQGEMICQNCGARPATVKWLGDGGTLALVHGFTKDWCSVCATQAQLVHARAAAARVSELEDEIVEAWHKNEITGPLHEALKMTREEYAAWVER